MDLLRTKDIAKTKGKTLDEVAKGIGITYSSLFKRVRNPKLSTLQEIANVLECELHELIECQEGYSHFYDDKTGEWLGIRKK